MNRPGLVFVAGVILLLLAVPGAFADKPSDWKIEKGSNGDVWVSASEPETRTACTTTSDCTNLAAGLKLEKADKFDCVTKSLPGHDDIKDKGPWCFRYAKPPPPPPVQACRTEYQPDADPTFKPDHKLCNFGGPKGSETVVILPMTPTTKVVDIPEDVHLPCGKSWECGRLAERFNRQDPQRFLCRKPVAGDGKELEPFGEGPFCFMKKDSDCKPGQEVDRSMPNQCSKIDVCRPMEELEYSECSGKGDWPTCVKNLKRPTSFNAADWTKCRKDRKDNKERRAKYEHSPYGKCDADCWSRLKGTKGYYTCKAKCDGLSTE